MKLQCKNSMQDNFLTNTGTTEKARGRQDPGIEAFRRRVRNILVRVVDPD
jgi:hypothetical protein